MRRITKEKTREIVGDFAQEIKNRKTGSPKPSTTVINFRTEWHEGIERPIVNVPLACLRFRKDNGRIASDILDYEKNVGLLDEKDQETQEIVRKFLAEKDPEKTSDLRKSILHSGQREPAIITCDGFLINGNRRKMVFDQFYKESGNENYGFMKVVILPGEDCIGGPPTLLDIEKLENRYQLQSDGRSEYYRFDRALSIRRKIGMGLSLKDQLRDDPRYAEASPRDLKKAVKETEQDFLEPLECIDRYLAQFRRDGLYRTISAGRSDSEGRWQAFIDYSKFYTLYLSNPKKRLELGIEEEEIGLIEDAAFKMIRLRVLKDLMKVHRVMQKLKNLCRSKPAKKEVIRISDEVEDILPTSECFDKEGRDLSREDIDRKWASKHQRAIIHRTKKAFDHLHNQMNKETPITLLESSYKKLIHEDMDVSSMRLSDLEEARTLAVQIQDRAKEIEGDIYHSKKNFKKLTRQ